jgi:hypothetical protein
MMPYFLVTFFQKLSFEGIRLHELAARQASLAIARHRAAAISRCLSTKEYMLSLKALRSTMSAVTTKGSFSFKLQHFFRGGSVKEDERVGSWIRTSSVLHRRTRGCHVNGPKYTCAVPSQQGYICGFTSNSSKAGLSHIHFWSVIDLCSVQEPSGSLKLYCGHLRPDTCQGYRVPAGLGEKNENR